MPPDLMIRPARLEDHARLCALWSVLDEAHRLARPDLFRRPEGPARTREWLAGALKKTDAAMLVAELDGRIAGLATVRQVYPTHAPFIVPQSHAELDEIVVAPDFRCLGIGRALVQAARRWTEALGLPRMTVQAFEFNREALAFYEAMGFGAATRRMEMTLGGRAEAAGLEVPPWA